MEITNCLGNAGIACMTSSQKMRSALGLHLCGRRMPSIYFREGSSYSC